MALDPKNLGTILGSQEEWLPLILHVTHAPAVEPWNIGAYSELRGNEEDSNSIWGLLMMWKIVDFQRAFPQMPHMSRFNRYGFMGSYQNF